MPQPPKLDLYLEEVKKFDFIFNVSRYFTFIKKIEKTIAVPFYVTVKKLNLKCKHLYEGKELEGKIKTFYCNNEDYIEIYAATGNKLVSCENCPKVKLL